MAGDFKESSQKEIDEQVSACGRWLKKFKENKNKEEYEARKRNNKNHCTNN